MESASPSTIYPGNSKVVAGVLAIFLGSLGVHRFYLNRLDGIAYLVLSVIGLWLLVFPFCVIQGIYCFLASDERWASISSPRSSEQIRKDRRRLFVGGSLGLVGLAGLFVYVANREENALADAHAFCDAVAVGDPIAPVKVRAGGVGARSLREISDERVSVGFVGIPPFSRHTCTVYAQGGLVTSADYFYLD